MTSFTIDKRVFDTLTQTGRIKDHITSQMICNGMDPDKPYEMLDVETQRVVRISQESSNEDTEVREQEAI